MLDHFLEVVCAQNKEAEAYSSMVQDLTYLPAEELKALAEGTSKLAYCEDSESQWLDKYEGTEFYPQALALEEAALDVDIRRKQHELEREQQEVEEPIRPNFYREKDAISLKKRILDLELNKAKLVERGGAQREIPLIPKEAASKQYKKDLENADAAAIDLQVGRGLGTTLGTLGMLAGGYGAHKALGGPLVRKLPAMALAGGVGQLGGRVLGTPLGEALSRHGADPEQLAALDRMSDREQGPGTAKGHGKLQNILEGRLAARPPGYAPADVVDELGGTVGGERAVSSGLLGAGLGVGAGLGGAALLAQQRMKGKWGPAAQAAKHFLPKVASPSKAYLSGITPKGLALASGAGAALGGLGGVVHGQLSGQRAVENAYKDIKKGKNPERSWGARQAVNMGLNGSGMAGLGGLAGLALTNGRSFKSVGVGAGLGGALGAGLGALITRQEKEEAAKKAKKALKLKSAEKQASLTPELLAQLRKEAFVPALLAAGKGIGQFAGQAGKSIFNAARTGGAKGALGMAGTTARVGARRAGQYALKNPGMAAGIGAGALGTSAALGASAS